MFLLIAVPESMTAAAADLANIGAAVSAAHMAVATPTAAVIPAAADEVSSSIAHLFSRHGHDYQALAGQAAAFHEEFVQHLTSSAGAYAGADVANVAMLQPLAAGTGAAAAAALGGPALSSLQDALILAMALSAVPFYLLMLSPFLLVIGLAIVLAPFVYLLEAIAALI